MSDKHLIHEHLMSVGLTRNEALAYVALLRHDEGGGLTGYEVANQSGIPRSAVYATLARLESQGACFVLGNKPARYVPTEPSAFVRGQRERGERRLDELERSLDAMPKRPRPEPVWILRGYDEVMEAAVGLIRSAKRSVYLSAWPRELQRLLPALSQVDHDALHCVLHCPTALGDRPVGFRCWVDNTAADDGKQRWPHRTLLVTDHHTALIGGAEPQLDNQAVQTSNPSIVNVALNQLILDITLLAKLQGVSCDEDVTPMIRPVLS